MQKHWLAFLAIGYLLFIAYGTLLPFDFLNDAVPALEAQSPVRNPDVSFADVVSNIALYVPLGLLLRAFFKRYLVSGLVGVVATILVVVTLSGALELIQLYSVSRYSSSRDVVCNALGAALGLAAHIPLSPLAVQLRRALTRELPTASGGVAILGWVTLIFVTSAAPFDITIDLSRVVAAVRSAHVIPFAKHHMLAETVAAPAETSMVVHQRALLALWELRIDYMVDVFFFFTLSILTALYLRRMEFKYRSTVFILLTYAAWLAAAVTFMELFIVSIGLDMTRLVTRLTGGLIGALCHQRVIAWILPSEQLPFETVRNRRRNVLLAGTVLCGAYITVRQLAPFTIDLEHAFDKIARIEWLPLQSYSLARVPVAVFDMLHKSFRFFALGAMLVLWRMQRDRFGLSAYSIRDGAVVAVAIALSEFCQCWLPARVPSVTDVLIAWTATAAGITTGKTLHLMIADLFTTDLLRRSRAVLNVEIGPPSDEHATTSPHEENPRGAPTG